MTAPGIADLARLHLDGTASPVEAVEATLAAIDQLDATVGAWQAVYAEEARAAALAAEKVLAAGMRPGPFCGVPYALKDIVDVEGRITTGGCEAWSERVSPASATIAKRLAAAGGVLVGKTKTVEIALGGWGTNYRMGTPRSPWDADVARTPGGSSAGSGAAVGSSMVTCAVGTDTGGSVRLPSAFCGIVGLKTTEGRLPTDGIIPLSNTLDTPGPMVRSVEDAALMFDTLLGRPGLDIDADWRERRGLYASIDRGIEGLRLASLGQREREAVDAVVLDRYDAALDELRGLGAMVEPFDPPRPFEDVLAPTFVIVTAEGFHHHGEVFSSPAALVNDDVRARLLPGRDITASQYVAATLQRARDQEEFATGFARFDAFVTPTVATPPIPIDTVDEDATPARFTRAVNYLAQCALAVPTPLTPDGLPTSIQIICRGNDEAMALRVGAAYERARGALPDPPLFAS